MQELVEGFSMILKGLFGIIGTLWWLWASVLGLCILVRLILFIRMLLKPQGDDGQAFFTWIQVRMFLAPVVIVSVVLLIIAAAVNFG